MPGGALKGDFVKVPRWWNNAKKEPTERLPDGARRPWTPTAQLDKRKTYQKRARHMLKVLNEEYEQLVSNTEGARKDFPNIRPGHIITVDLVVPENDLRPGHFTGIVTGVRRNGPMTRFWMRNVLPGTGALERSFLVNSPFLKGVTIHRKRKVRLAKLTYLRKKKDSESRFADAGSLKSRQAAAQGDA